MGEGGYSDCKLFVKTAPTAKRVGAYQIRPGWGRILGKKGRIIGNSGAD